MPHSISNGIIYYREKSISRCGFSDFRNNSMEGLIKVFERKRNFRIFLPGAMRAVIFAQTWFSRKSFQRGNDFLKIPEYIFCDTGCQNDFRYVLRPVPRSKNHQKIQNPRGFAANRPLIDQDLGFSKAWDFPDEEPKSKQTSRSFDPNLPRI